MDPDLIEAVSNINEELFKISGEDNQMMLEVRTDGTSTVVLFSNFALLDEESQPPWDELKNEQEPLEPWLRKQFNLLLYKLALLQVKV